MADCAMLNIGCGATHHPSWVNIDMAPPTLGVRYVNILKGLPFADNSFSYAYSSHVLEHLTPVDADKFLLECRRVLAPNGILRLVVPDLEGIAREYIRLLDAVGAGDQTEESRLRWIVLELLDQMVRERPGGDMGKMLRQIAANDRPYVRSRLGQEAEAFWSAKENHPHASQHSLAAHVRRLGKLVSNCRENVAEIAVRLIAGRNGVECYKIGRFRMSGEVHRWMYDRHSLGQKLRRVGFSDVVIRPASESRIPNFSTYALDEVNGETRKPDSMFIEAVKIGYLTP